MIFFSLNIIKWVLIFQLYFFQLSRALCTDYFTGAITENFLFNAIYFIYSKTRETPEKKIKKLICPKANQN